MRNGLRVARSCRMLVSLDTEIIQITLVHCHVGKVKQITQSEIVDPQSQRQSLPFHSSQKLIGLSTVSLLAVSPVSDAP